MTIHNDIRSLRDRYKRTAAEVREAGRQSAYQLALAELCDDVAERLDGVLERYEGYVVVPREPTEAMMEAYKHAFVSEQRFDGAKVYRAMIEAAEQKP